ncbi:MAG: hypothetical protein WCQ21_01795 [Verrucomicrobiota bacterium]|jgi:hypothetical protein
MKSTLTLLIGGVVLVGVAGLALSQDEPAPNSRPKLTAPREAQTSAPAVSARAAADFPVIAYIEKRDRNITIKAGAKWPVYTVKGADGKVLFENLSREQLLAQAPELGAYLKTAVAGTPGARSDARVRVKMDASLGSFGGR